MKGREGCVCSELAADGVVGCGIAVPVYEQDAVDESVRDAQVAEIMANFSLWATRDCKQAVRTVTCVNAYVPVSQPSVAYCSESCLATLDICGSYWNLNGDTRQAYEEFAASCGSDNSPGCYEADSADIVPLESDEPICPAMLVVPDRTSLNGDGEIHGIDGTACAMPCPSLWYSTPKLEQFNATAVALLCISAIAATISAVGLYIKKQFLLTVYAGAAALGAILYFGLVLGNDGVNSQFNLTCDGNAGYIEKHPAVVGCGVLLIFMLSTCYTSALLVSIRIWASVAFGYRFTDSADVKLCLAGFWIPFFITITVASGGAVGYDFKSQPIIPYLLFGDYPDYYWVFFSPLFSIVHLQLLVSLHTLYCSNRAVLRAFYQRQTFINTLLTSLSRNRKMIVFMVVHVLTAMYVLYLALFYYEIDDRNYVNDTQDYFRCLLRKGAHDPDVSRHECGGVPKIPSWAYLSLNLYQVVFGLLPFLVFGDNGAITELVNWWHSYGRKSTDFNAMELSGSRKQDYSAA